MTLKEKFKWESDVEGRLQIVKDTQAQIADGKAQRVTYYWFVGSITWYAIEVYLEGDAVEAKQAAVGVVGAALEYFYGEWREKLETEDGKRGTEAWKPFCLWYDEVMQSLPFAAALSDWESMKRIAAYPPENKLPEAAKAKGETAWGWALITFLRGQAPQKVEEFLVKAVSDKAKRPKVLAPVLTALLENNNAKFEKALMEYLAFYKKSEFKRIVDKVMSLDGTILYHLGRKQGFAVELPGILSDHIIQFPMALTILGNPAQQNERVHLE